MLFRAAASSRTIRTTVIAIFCRRKTTSAQYVAARHRDPTLEKLMDGYKHLISVLFLQDLILSSPDLSIPLPFLSSPEASRHLRLRRGPAHFVRSFPAVFSLRPHPTASLPALVYLTPAASRLSEHVTCADPFALERITRLLSLSSSRSFPLRALIRVRHELGLPQDFEDSVIASNPLLFSLSTNPREAGTHIVSLANPAPTVVPAVDAWRLRRLEDLNQNDSESAGEDAEIRFGFKQTFPPGMRLTKGFRSRLKEWQRLPYPRPYEPLPSAGGSLGRRRALEKRAVAIAHEFLSLTVEKMVEVEKFSHFRKSFGIDLNIRDLLLDHPGMFYLSTKGRRHTVFLREAYDRGCLIESNPIYEARRKLLHLVQMRKRGAAFADSGVPELVNVCHRPAKAPESLIN
ncbi:protein ROOT PRIMORDIUM DEFECTIVE 1 [Phalaenopsis equestris]|uniref:protein ROOT PRIMORDIUM DEFECTIVE 1 n=1 Tax=Phalaenopsis equestris TaxID=78828 RepID=UPI0009E61178|nr:protein ROOT PRIMORDIUM DEFECTIVE 1 [Phalaenopsis equestris]